MVRVLVVDDHEVVRRGLALILREGLPDAQVEMAGDAASAMRLLETEAWDLALLDLNIPGRSGMEVLEEVRRRWPRTPVLIVSAHPEEEFAVRCMKLGAAGYVTKTSAADELLTAARKALAGGKYVTSTLAERLADAVGGDVDAAPHEALSTRELQVLQMIALGHTQREIAESLHLSEKTIATYRARLGEKLGLSTNVDLTRYAVRHKLVQ